MVESKKSGADVSRIIEIAVLVVLVVGVVVVGVMAANGSIDLKSLMVDTHGVSPLTRESIWLQ